MKRYLSIFTIALVLISTAFTATAYGANQQPLPENGAEQKGLIEVTKAEELLRAHIKCSQGLFEEHIKWSERLFEEHVKWARGLSAATAPDKEAKGDTEIHSDAPATVAPNAEEAETDNAAVDEQPGMSANELLNQSRNWIEKHIQASGERLQSHIKWASGLFENTGEKEQPSE